MPIPRPEGVKLKLLVTKEGTNEWSQLKVNHHNMVKIKKPLLSINWSRRGPNSLAATTNFTLKPCILQKAMVLPAAPMTVFLSLFGRASAVVNMSFFDMLVSWLRLSTSAGIVPSAHLGRDPSASIKQKTDYSQEKKTKSAVIQHQNQAVRVV